MRSTLFYIPQEIPGDPLGLPVFGLGWLLIAWALASTGLILWRMRSPNWKEEAQNLLPALGVVGLGIAVVLPRILERDGMPIRAYGVLMVVAVVSGVGLAAYRAWSVGVDPEIIYSLATWMTISGLVGARLFFVLQYWGDFYVAGNPLATLGKVLNFPQGGLVVYGAVLGGFPVGVGYLLYRRLPVLAIADIAAPSLVLGLAIGRLGCFFNGCCYGGFCEATPPGLRFPASSPPYEQQIRVGWRSAIWLATSSEPNRVRVAYVAPGSSAEQAGVKKGDLIRGIAGTPFASLAEAQQLLALSVSGVELELSDGRVLRWAISAPPARTAPIHPAQLYAAVDAGLLALLLWLAYPFRRREGEIAALLLTIQPISRILLEIVRVDERGQFGTELTISQWVSVGILLVAAGLWAHIERQPAGSLLGTQK